MLLLSAMGLVSCSEESPKVIPDFSNYNPSELNQQFFADKVDSEFSFSSISSWTAVVDDDPSANSDTEPWLTLSSTSGVSGDHVITINVKKNTTGADRQGSIVLTSGKSTISILVEQLQTLEDGSVPEKIYPVDFRYITLSGTGMRGEDPLVSYIKNDGTVIPDYYYQVHNESVGENPGDVIQVKDNIILLIQLYWCWNTTNKIQILNSNSFEEVKTIDFGSDLSPHSIVNIKDDNMFLLVGGETKSNNTYSLNIIDIESNKPIKSSFEVPFSAQILSKVGDKIVVVGGRESEGRSPSIAFFDVNNITLEGMRQSEIDMGLLYTNKVSLEKDKNNNLWTLMVNANYEIMLCCIDMETEKIIHNIKVPAAITSTTSLAVSNDGASIYVRTHEAFYKLNVDNAIFSEDPLFEHREHTGTVNDLKMTKEGTLLFIDERLEDGAPSVVYEYKENADGNWTRLLEKGVAVGRGAGKLYVAKYEK